MQQDYSFTARVEDGQLKIRLRTLQLLRTAVRNWRRCPVTVTIERQHATRSLDQNAYYFGCVLALLSEHTGYTVDELHAYCKERFNAKTLILVNAHGEITDEKTIGQSTTKLNKVTFGEYCEAIRQWAAEDLGVVIPDPDPAWREKESAA